MAVRRDQVQDSELFPELIDVLVEGWGGHYTWIDPSDRAFDVWQMNDDELRAVWRRHQPTLRMEATRRGLAHPWAEEVYDLTPPAWLRETRR